MSQVVDALMMQRIEKFDSFVKDFCEQRGIDKNFISFLTHKTTPTQYVPDSYNSLYRAPLELLVSSKSFKDFYDNLDEDFKQDLVPHDTYRSQFLTLATQQSIQKILKSYLKEDCVW